MTSLDTDIALVRRQTLGDLLHRSAARHPDRVAITDGRVTRTYEDLDGDANRLAHALIERGVEVGDRVAVLSRNSVAYVQTIFAVSRCGAVLVPINFMLNGAEVGYLLQHSGSTALVVQDELMATAEAGIEATGTVMPVRVVVGDRADVGWELLDALLAHPDVTDPAVPVAAEAPAQVMYTSGTESRPKGAVLSHSALIAQYASCIIDGGMGPADVDLHALPLYHCAQQHCFLLPEIYLGARGVIPPSTDPAVLLEMIERYGVNKFFAPPTVWIALLRHRDFDRRDLSSLRKGYYGAAIMPVEVLKEIGDRLPGIRLWNFYGQTEMGPVAVMLQPEDQVRKAGSAGQACLNVETRVVTADGTPCAPGEVGEIVHRSPHVILGYLDDPERTAEAFRGGWFHSGDLGVVDDEGYLTVVDRIKDMIKTGGENVASREVEEALYEHEGVAEVAVVGISHATWIEAVVAIVVPRPGAAVDVADLRTHARARLAPFKVPKAFALVETLPKNASGKLLKRELRDQFAHLAAEIDGGRATAASGASPTGGNR
jgi:fatty-acyl-CoA synthase